ncbi:hypothetical protein KC660_01680, partial [Candidatus Dojkabacteria bacterium]|nr:hypothetical protein [Candidatus Dojkabacteria bacterium]
EDPFQVIKQLWKEDGGVVTDLDRLLNYDLVPPLGLASEITKFTYLYIYKYIFSALFQNFQSESKLVKEYDVILTGELGGNLGSNDFLIQNLAASTPLTGIYNLYVDKKNILTSISQLEQLLHISIDKAKYLLKFQVISFEDSQKKYSEKDTLCTITINNERQILPYNDIIWGFEWNENEELNITIDFEKGVTIKNLVDGSVSLQQGKGYNGIVIDTTSSLPNDITLFQKWHKDISENFRL